MTELPLVFGVIAATIGVMIWLLLIFRGFFRLREERAPDVVHVHAVADEAPAKAPAANSGRQRAA